MKVALLLAVAMVLGSCHGAPPPPAAPVIEAIQPEGVRDDPGDMPIAMP